MLVAVCGLPGAGKTTVAEFVADERDAELLRTDVVRQDLFADPEYTPEERRRVYEAMFDRARGPLRAGTDVVLDGTFNDRALRDAAADLAADTGDEFRIVKVECAPAVAQRRIAARSGDASEADADVHAHFRDRFDDLAREHDTVDNSESIDRTRAQVAALF